MIFLVKFLQKIFWNTFFLSTFLFYKSQNRLAYYPGMSATYYMLHTLHTVYASDTSGMAATSHAASLGTNRQEEMDSVIVTKLCRWYILRSLLHCCPGVFFGKIAQNSTCLERKPYIHSYKHAHNEDTFIFFF